MCSSIKGREACTAQIYHSPPPSRTGSQHSNPYVVRGQSNRQSASIYRHARAPRALLWSQPRTTSTAAAASSATQVDRSRPARARAVTVRHRHAGTAALALDGDAVDRWATGQPPGETLLSEQALLRGTHTALYVPAAARARRCEFVPPPPPCVTPRGWRRRQCRTGNSSDGWARVEP